MAEESKGSIIRMRTKLPSEHARPTGAFRDMVAAELFNYIQDHRLHGLVERISVEYLPEGSPDKGEVEVIIGLGNCVESCFDRDAAFGVARDFRRLMRQLEIAVVFEQDYILSGAADCDGIDDRLNRLGPDVAPLYVRERRS